MLKKLGIANRAEDTSSKNEDNTDTNLEERNKKACNMLPKLFEPYIKRKLVYKCCVSSDLILKHGFLTDILSFYKKCLIQTNLKILNSILPVDC